MSDLRARVSAGRSVAVIGAGWAGLAAAVRLAQNGVACTLFEASKTLGGRGIMISSPMTTLEDRRRAEDDQIETAPSLSAAIDMLFGLTARHAAP